MQTLTRFHRQLAALPQFVVLASPPVPPETDLKAMVRDILEGAPDRIYRDGIESVDSAALDENGDLVGEFSDRIGVRSIKKFSYKISDDGVEYELLNPDEVSKFSVYQSDVLAMFSTATAKKKNCLNSVPCGNGCTKRGNKCRKGGAELSDGTKAKIKKAKALADPAKSKAGTVETISPDGIEVDPKRFQYKIIGATTKSGEVGSLSGVKAYNPDLAGIIQVWQDPTDGKTYVVNGHNRLALAKKLGAEEVTVRYLNVKDAGEARAVGALTNIAEGRGDALDAAKFFKDTGLGREDLDIKGIPIREKIATDGLALASLEPSLFTKAVNGDLTIERAAIIGGSGLDHAQQKALQELADKRSKPVNNDVLKELADGVRQSSTDTETQFDLFGSTEASVTNAIERATLQSVVKRRLSRDKKLFATVGKSKAAVDLSKAGNIIDVAESQKVSKEAGAILHKFNTLKNLKGSLSDALNDHATDLLKGGDRKKIENDLYKKVFEILKND
jgi:ParB-like chromosome segregation protein Spo0J